MDPTVLPPRVDLFLQRDHSAGQAVGDHAYTGEADVSQLGLHNWDLCFYRLFDPHHIIF
jgi:hypothetical protein